jgi:putative phosphoesterase
MRVLLLADTHIGPHRPGRRLPDGVYDLLVDGVEAIVHAGDVTAPELLHELGGFGPVHAVLGNNDVGIRLPERLETDLDGVRLAVVHDGGAAAGRAARLRRWFPAADVVVFGHSHLPWDETDAGGQRHLNPGSPTERRRAPTRTCGLLDVRAGRIEGYELVDLGT